MSWWELRVNDGLDDGDSAISLFGEFHVMDLLLCLVCLLYLVISLCHAHTQVCLSSGVLNKRRRTSAHVVTEVAFFAVELIVYCSCRWAG